MRSEVPVQRGPERLPWAWGEPVAELVFLWLCQLRRAPYSYDWIDNFGRRSPRKADPQLSELEVGQSVMTIFTLTGFEPGASLNLRMNSGWPRRAFGDLRLQYRAEALGPQSSRLSAVMWMPPIGRLLGSQRRYLLAWGDLIMMRKQLLVLRELAEYDAAP